MQRTEKVPTLELAERDHHRLKVIFREDAGNASGSRQGEHESSLVRSRR